MYYKAFMKYRLSNLFRKDAVDGKGTLRRLSGAGLELLCMAERVIIGFGEYAYAQPVILKSY